MLKRKRGRPRKNNEEFITPDLVTDYVESTRKEMINFTLETLERLKIGMMRGIDETGGLTIEDVNYNIELVSRMIKHRYKTK